ncbi:carboxymuconolactone decarboxylase family protein [Nocardioides rubriscoriae]|uniref:carboxymuconolactone decarboxylase family protein n=1 Tax=Nocardioides rubriscoriae TaxID=642762 RepID=UPI0011DF5076|nr:carboxymuconolactone decarboxylase family protein [Nocardioides rubriscoriae]
MTRSDLDSTSGARIAPATPPLDPDVQAAIDLVMRGNAPLVLFTTLARDGRLFERFFGGGLLDRGHLTIRQREIVIDRVTARCGAEYEWGVHVATYAARAGLDAEQVASLTTGGPADPCWTDDERVLVELADSLLDTCDVDDSLWSRLAQVHSEEAILELLMLVGAYRSISCLVRSLRLPFEPGAARFADVTR